MSNTLTLSSALNLAMPLSNDIEIDCALIEEALEALEVGDNVTDLVSEDVYNQMVSISVKNVENWISVMGYDKDVGFESTVVNANCDAGAYNVNFVIDAFAESEGWEEFMDNVAMRVDELI